jgi:hypothetical protein
LKTPVMSTAVRPRGILRLNKLIGIGLRELVIDQLRVSRDGILNGLIFTRDLTLIHRQLVVWATTAHKIA